MRTSRYMGALCHLLLHIFLKEHPSLINQCDIGIDGNATICDDNEDG